MARYIDADKLIKTIFPIGLVDDGKYSINAKAVKYAIDETPTADAVDVVRCKDCKHFETCDFDGDVLVGCMNLSGLTDVSPNGFCSYGERMEQK